MTNSLNSSARFLLGAGLIAVALVFVALPVLAAAATYAYVDQTGDVRTVESATPDVAIMTAPNIDEHSGVMLLTNPNDPIVGDNVPSV